MVYFTVIMTFVMFLLWVSCYQNIIVIAAEFIVEEEAGITANYFSGNYIKACCGGEFPGSMELVRDANGTVIYRKGISAEMMRWMGRSQNVTFGCVTSNGKIYPIENTSTSIGATFRLKTGVCDLAPGPIVITHSRFQEIDFLHPWTIEPVVLLMPAPVVVTGSISALWKPFETNVWIVLMVSAAIIIIGLVTMDHFSSHQTNRSNLYWIFVVGILFSRAASNLSNRKITVRILESVWCLTGLLLGLLYSSILISFIMAPNPQPLVNSVKDLAEKKDVGLIVFKNFAPESQILKSDDRVMKKLALKLKSDSNSRCSNLSTCVDQVKTSSSVMIHQYGPVMVALNNDYKRTRKCNLAMAKNIFDSYPGAWMIPKNSSFVESFNIGTLIMLESGLLAKWKNEFQPTSKQCLGPPGYKQQIEEMRRPMEIKLIYMKAAFFVLFLGFGLSFLAFLMEQLCYKIYSKNINTILDTPDAIN